MSTPRVLVVDDEQVVVEAARRVLGLEGLRPEGVVDGGVALQRLRSRTFDLVLLDLVLPGVSGLDLLRAVVGELPDTPVVVTTGYASSRKCVEVLGAGAFDFLPKPFDVDELLGVVRRALHYAGVAASGMGAEHEAYFLGSHSWARLEPDGQATLGLAEGFFGALGASPRIRLPAIGEEVVQGKCFARIERGGSSAHQVWSPLSGRVVSVNPRLESEPVLAGESPIEAGWLSRITPTNLRAELDQLIHRRPAPRRGRGNKDTGGEKWSRSS
jgi:CheY-like chemotaxis protein